MDIALSGMTLRGFYRSVASLSKLGAEVLIEATGDREGQRNGGLTIKAINTARSAFLSVTFKSTSFDAFNVTVPEGTLQTAVYAKHLLAALRTQKVERVLLSQAVDAPEKISIQLECGRGTLRKTFGVHCVTDAAHLRATLDPSTMPIKIAFRPKELSRMLSHFQSAQADITISCAPEDGAGDVLRDANAPAKRNLKLSSYLDPNAPAGQALQTSVSLDSGGQDAVLRYEHDGGEQVDVTVNLKDLRVMTGLCEQLDVDVVVYIDEPGAPVLVRPTAEYRAMGGDNRGNQSHQYNQNHQSHQHHQHQQHGRGYAFDPTDVDFDAELVLASMLPRIEQEPSQTLGGTTRTQQMAGDTRAGHNGPPGTSGRESELTEKFPGRSGKGEPFGGRGGPSVGAAASTGIPDSVDGSTPVDTRQRETVTGPPADVQMAWAPGDLDDDDGGDDWLGEYVEATPPNRKKQRNK